MTEPQRRALWEVAQHKYGWGYVRRSGRTFAALERRGLVTINRDRTDHTATLTEEGLKEVERRWPISPAVCSSYKLPMMPWGIRAEHWDRLDDDHLTCAGPAGAVGYMDNGMGFFYPGIPCLECGRFVGRDGWIGVEHFEMSTSIASIEGECRRCLGRDASPSRTAGGREMDGNATRAAAA